MKPVVLIIMDGWGLNPRKEGNAVALARKPNFNNLWKKYPHTTLKAAGPAVGLPEGMMGNSETGHLNIGAGRIVLQDLVRINKAINDGSFFENKALLKAIENVKKKKSTLHLMGLLSDQGVHSHMLHLYALLKLAAEQGVKDVVVHVFTDGRDTPPQSARRYLADLNDQIRHYGVGRIATVTGRYYAMDRDNHWERTEIAYNAIVEAQGHRVKDFMRGIEDAYRLHETDEFLKPIIAEWYGGVKNGDSVIFYNYRLDRARQLTRAFIEPRFKEFERKRVRICYVCMTEYYRGVPLVAFEPLDMTNILGEVIAKKGMRQLRIAETEKYAHVTFFFNGQIEKPFRNEARILIPSPRVATYDLKPEMSAPEVTAAVVKEIKSGKYHVIILNYANCDMVGHTGNLEAAVRAVEAVDKAIGDVVSVVRAKKGVAIVTADHGNAEQMIDYETGQPWTAHTTNDVPFILVSNRKFKLREGILADIAPTMLELLEIPKPKEMDGESLIMK